MERGGLETIYVRGQNCSRCHSIENGPPIVWCIVCESMARGVVLTRRLRLIDVCLVVALIAKATGLPQPSRHVVSINL